MKTHAIIPIFIPHYGCPNDCVFCNQKIITARSAAPNQASVNKRIRQYLPTLCDRGIETVEVAFFGGSFTGIPLTEQNVYLDVARRYKISGEIDKIRISTRPDYIDEKVLSNLKIHDVDIIELGVQSFDSRVLSLSKRGHTVEDVYQACKLIRECDFQLGIQLMIGLPGDTREKSIDSARKTVALSPKYARLYPTVILEHTELAELYAAGKYLPFSHETMLETTKEMYGILFEAGITILRVGLKSTDLVTAGADLSGGYHPAFRQLVEGEIIKEKMLSILESLSPDTKTVTFFSNRRWFSAMIGHKACNKKALTRLYPELNIRFRVDATLSDGQVEGQEMAADGG